jgi:hypothetical protein
MQLHHAIAIEDALRPPDRLARLRAVLARVIETRLSETPAFVPRDPESRHLARLEWGSVH